jgi:hypothetical protein
VRGRRPVKGIQGKTKQGNNRWNPDEIQDYWFMDL